MRKGIVTLLVLCFLCASLVFLNAQQASQTPSAKHSPPKILVIVREFVKPGRSGSMHAKAESAFVNAMASSKWPTHYLGMDSQTGPSRSLFFTGFDSFDAWQKDSLATQKNAVLSAALDRAAVADGDLLTSIETSTFLYREDLSYNPGLNIAEMRYMEIYRAKVRPGHDKDWADLVKLYQMGYEKSMPGSHWATYMGVYGHLGDGTYLIIVPMKSAAEVDANFASYKKFGEALGEENMKKLADLSAACIENSETNLFAFNPEISYVSEDWIKTDSFWKRATMVAAKKAEGKTVAEKKPEMKPAQ